MTDYTKQMHALEHGVPLPDGACDSCGCIGAHVAATYSLKRCTICGDLCAACLQHRITQAHFCEWPTVPRNIGDEPAIALSDDQEPTP